MHVFEASPFLSSSPAHATVVWHLRSRAIRDQPQRLLRVLVMLIRADFPALCGGTGPLSAWVARAVLLRCWKGLHCLSAAWHVRSVHGRWHVNNRFTASTVTSTISQLRTSSERKLSLSATRQPFMVEIALPYVFSLSNSLVFVSFLCLSNLSHRQEQGGSMSSMQVVEQSPGHTRDGSEKVRTFDKRTLRHKLFDRQRFVSVSWLRHAQLRNLVEVWALMGDFAASSRVLAARSKPVYFFRSNLCRFLSKFAWALPLSLSSPWTMIFFSVTTRTDKKWDLVPNARLPR